MSRLRYPKEYYSLSYAGFSPLTQEQKRHEYDVLSRKANKYLERVSRSEFAEQQFYKQYYGKFDKPSGELSERELEYRLADLARYLSSEKASYTGARKSRREAVKSMKESGYTWVTYKNYGDFSKFMDLVKTSYGEHIYDSKRIVEYYEEHKQQSITPSELFADFVQFQSGGVRSNG